MVFEFGLVNFAYHYSTLTGDNVSIPQLHASAFLAIRIETCQACKQYRYYRTPIWSAIP